MGHSWLMEIKKLDQESFFRDKLIHHRLIFFFAGGVSEAVVPIYISANKAIGFRFLLD